MSFPIALRKFISRSSVIALVAAALSLMTAPAHAVGGYEPTEYFFTRTSTDGHSLVVKPGEFVDFASRYELSSSYTGWPAATGTKFSRTALVPAAASIANLTTDGTVYRWWNGYGDGCDGASTDTANLVIDTSSSCINQLDVTDRFQGTNETASNITINTNANAQVTKRVKKDITSVAGAQTQVYGNMRVDSGASYTIGANEDYVAAHFTLCINEDRVSAGDVLDLSVSMSHAGTPISSGSLDVSDWNDNDGDVLTYTVPEGNPYDQKVTIDVSPASTSAGVYTARADVLSGSRSVLETCPNYTASTFPTGVTTNGISGSPDATTTVRTMPTSTYTSNTDWWNYGTYADGFGGVLHYGWVNSTSNVRLVNMTPSGANNSFASTGSYTLARNADDGFDFQRFGAGGANYASVSPAAKGKWTVTTGAMTSSAPTVSTIAAAKITALCPAKYSFGGFFPIAAPTPFPVAQGYCFSGTNQKWFLVKFEGATPTILATIGASTVASPCVGFAFGVDAGATGTETAIIGYTRAATRDVDGMCTTNGATVRSRALISVTADGVASTATLANPWGSSGEPAQLELAPAATANNWIGISFTQPDMYVAAVPVGLFTMTSTSVSKKSDIVLDRTTDFGQNLEIAPVKAVSGSRWLLRLSGTQQIDGEEIARATVASVNPNTGVVTNGDVVEFSGFQVAKSRSRGVFSTDGNGNATYYQILSNTTYSTTTWALP